MLKLLVVLEEIMPNSILVVPSCRSDSLHRFLNSWDLSQFDDIIIVEDAKKKSDLGIKYHYSWKEIDEDLKDKSWIIGRKNSAIKSYGFLKAYQMGADYIFTLDDDTTGDNNFVKSHIHNMELTAKWGTTVDGLVVRGIPYHNKGILNNVNLSVSLWDGYPDLDAPHQLINNISNFVSPRFNRILPHGQYFPICGMALAFKKCLIPLMYFQGFFDRFDDIFCGIICKKICDHLGWYIACGSPIILHAKASNPFDNLIKEVEGIKINETLWELIDAVKLTGKNASECMLEISDCLEKTMDDKLSIYGRAIKLWIGLLK